ncbi:MAG: hypothetical protein AAGJ18_29955, partial [Bacteroidota bacterium]
MDNYNYFLKGDISGIQEFIFNVPSEGAAKSLKGRSFFVEMLSLIGVEKIKQQFGKDNVRPFYNGGGNFYLELVDFSEAQLREIQAELQATCHHYNFYLALACVAKEATFQATWDAVNLAMEKAKLNKFASYQQGYMPYQAPERRVDKEGELQPIFDWKALSQFFRNNPTTYSLARDPKNEVLANHKGLRVFGWKLTDGEQLYEDVNIDLSLPRWNATVKADSEVAQLIEKENTIRKSRGEKASDTSNGVLIEFAYLAGFAGLKSRAHTPKLGILKMDVDDLGFLFDTLAYDEGLVKTVSKLFGDFFGQRLVSLLKQPVFPQSAATTGPVRYIDNIYPVFSGGDDCFFVGSWDAILEWTNLLHQAFEELAKVVHQTITNFIEKAEQVPLALRRIKPCTISSGIVLLEPSYPVTRFADLAQT